MSVPVPQLWSSKEGQSAVDCVCDPQLPQRLEFLHCRNCGVNLAAVVCGDCGVYGSHRTIPTGDAQEEFGTTALPYGFCECCDDFLHTYIMQGHQQRLCLNPPESSTTTSRPAQFLRKVISQVLEGRAFRLQRKLERERFRGLEAPPFVEQLFKHSWNYNPETQVPWQSLPMEETFRIGFPDCTFYPDQLLSFGFMTEEGADAERYFEAFGELPSVISRASSVSDSFSIMSSPLSRPGGLQQQRQAYGMMMTSPSLPPRPTQSGNGAQHQAHPRAPVRGLEGQPQPPQEQQLQLQQVRGDVTLQQQHDQQQHCQWKEPGGANSSAEDTERDWREGSAAPTPPILKARQVIPSSEWDLTGEDATQPQNPGDTAVQSRGKVQPLHQETVSKYMEWGSPAPQPPSGSKSQLLAVHRHALPGQGWSPVPVASSSTVALSSPGYFSSPAPPPPPPPLSRHQPHDSHPHPQHAAANATPPKHPHHVPPTVLGGITHALPGYEMTDRDRWRSSFDSSDVIEEESGMAPDGTGIVSMEQQEILAGSFPPPLPEDSHDPQMRGPFPLSNWIIPGRALCGCYPGNRPEVMKCLLEEGIRVFVCAQAEVQSHPDFPPYARPSEGLSARHMWKSYVDDVRDLLVHRGEDPAGFEFMHLPILNNDVATDPDLARFAAKILQRLFEGKRVYIHCHDGHGRTGSVVAALLGLTYDLHPADALHRTSAYHDCREIDEMQDSPVTHEQRMQIYRILQNDKVRKLAVQAQSFAHKKLESAKKATSTTASPFNNHTPGWRPAVWESAPISAEEFMHRREALLQGLPLKPNGRAPLPQEGRAPISHRSHGSQQMAPSLPPEHRRFEAVPDEEELRRVVVAIAEGMRNSHGTLKEKFDRYDQERSKFLSLENFKTACRKELKMIKESDACLEHAFSQFDVDGDGKLRYFEFVRIFATED